ncbi:reverse transcriptase, partial [Tanacetum coccineum]
KSSLLVVVDKLSKYAHVLPITHPYTALQVAQLFLDNVYKLHGLPKTIVSDRDKVFISLFWQSLFKMLQVKLKMSTAYHPQTDGQTKIVNKCLETYLSVLNTTLYEVVYGSVLPMHIPYVAKDSPVEAVDRTLQAREQVVQLLKFNLKKTHDRMKSQADKRRSDRSFDPFQSSLVLSSSKEDWEATMGSFPLCDKEGLLAATPLKLLDRRMVKQNNRMVVFGLVQWSNGSEEDTT